MATALLVIAGISHNVYADNIYPSNGLFQEMAGTISSGEVSVDLINTTGFRDYVRVGLPTGGEAIYAMNHNGLADMAGYKHLFNRSIGAYGLVGYDSDSDGTDTVAGISYSGMMTNGFMYNLNVELVSPGGDGEDSTTEIKAGGYYTIKNRSFGRTTLMAEYVMDSSNDSSGIFAAVRFVPNNNIRIDVGVYESFDSGSDRDSSTGMPLFFRLNLKI
jgi:hypothetical protein